MLKCKVKEIGTYSTQIKFTNTKCGHLQDWVYSTRGRCDKIGCNEKTVDFDKLLGDKNQGNRVKYFVDGEV